MHNIQLQVIKTFFHEEGVGDVTATDMIYLQTHQYFCVQHYKKEHPEYSDETIEVGSIQHRHSIPNKIELIEPELEDEYRKTLVQRRLKVQVVGLESEVNQRNRMDSIKTFLKLKRPMTELHPDSLDKPIILSIEGVTGSGKTELISALEKYLNKTQKVRDDIMIMPDIAEELSKIVNSKGDNICNLYNKSWLDDSEHLQYTFELQILLCTTIRSTLQKMVKKNPLVKYIICKGSLLTAWKVHERMLHEQRHILEIEHQVYESLFLDETLNWMMPKKMIYIRRDPDDCYYRVACERLVCEQRDGLKTIMAHTTRDIREIQNRYESLPEIQSSTCVSGNPINRKDIDSWVTATISQMPRL